MQERLGICKIQLVPYFQIHLTVRGEYVYSYSVVRFDSFLYHHPVNVAQSQLPPSQHCPVFLDTTQNLPLIFLSYDVSLITCLLSLLSALHYQPVELVKLRYDSLPLSLQVSICAS
jgi:hypothetical protein